MLTWSNASEQHLRWSRVELCSESVDEGRLRAAVGRRGVPSHSAGVLAQPYPPLAAAAAGLRCRPRGGGRDRGAWGAAPAGVGLHGAEDAVATQDTVTQLVAAIRRVRRLIPAARAVKLGAHDYDRPGKPDCDWDDSDAKQALVSGLVNDALAVLAAVATPSLGAEQAEAVALLALVAGQDVEAGERPGTFRIARRVARDRVISTVDPPPAGCASCLGHWTLCTRRLVGARTNRGPGRPGPRRTRQATMPWGSRMYFLAAPLSKSW